MLLTGLILYYIFLIITSKSPVTVELVNHVNVIVNKKEDIIQEEMPRPEAIVREDEMPQRLEHSFVEKKQEQSKKLPSKVLDNNVMNQNVKYMENVLSKMEKSMTKDDAKVGVDLGKLPKPREMLDHAIGPVSRLDNTHHLMSAIKRGKFIVMAREDTGYPVLGQFFIEENGFFEHGELMGESTDVTGNLLNCILAPELVINFHNLAATAFGRTRYFTRTCLQESDSVCDDPLSYEHKCSKYPFQVLRTKHYSLSFAREMLSDYGDVNIIYMIRDPRGILKDNTKAKPRTLCSELSQEWDEAVDLKTEFPEKFLLARYEDLAVAPLLEASKLLKPWNISFETSNNSNDEEWSVRKNPLQQVNSWKSQLSSSQLKQIENSCLETLSKLEYQPIAAV